MGTEAKYVVRLTTDERAFLMALVGKGRVARDKQLRARILLKADVSEEGGPRWTDLQLAEAFDVSLSTVHRLRERLVEDGFAAALTRKPRSRPKPPKLDGAKEARLVALACSAPPAGRARWTLKLLADRLVELNVVDSISDETVRLRLKKTLSNRGSVGSG
jgi:transposase